MEKFEFDAEHCALARVSKIIQGKWGMVILYLLSDGTLRFGELKRKLPFVAEANLIRELRLLEQYGVIHRKSYPVVPPKVEYSLTEMGQAFLPILEEICNWAEQYTVPEQ